MKKKDIFVVSSLSLFFAFSTSVNALEIDRNKIKDSILNTRIGVTDKSLSIGNNESQITLVDDGNNRGVNVKIKDKNVDVNYTKERKEVKVDNFIGNDIEVSYEKGKHEVKVNNKRGSNIDVSHKDDANSVQINGTHENGISVTHSDDLKEVAINGSHNNGASVIHSDDLKKAEIKGTHGNSINITHSDDLKEVVVNKDNKEVIKVDTNYNKENVLKDTTTIEQEEDKHVIIDKDKVSVSHKGLVEITKTKLADGTRVLLKIWCPLGYRINITKFVDNEGHSKIENIRLSYNK